MIAVTALTIYISASKEYLTNRLIIYKYIQHSLSVLSVLFIQMMIIQIGWQSSQSYARKNSDFFRDTV